MSISLLWLIYIVYVIFVSLARLQRTLLWARNAPTPILCGGRNGLNDYVDQLCRRMCVSIMGLGNVSNDVATSCVHIALYNEIHCTTNYIHDSDTVLFCVVYSC